ncbi:hypothetical protein FYK55_25070 [Roseiconus nitratireducens]|uniref:Uncharacterized protein n=1 Tax=Roseiconus nitratireducens TaxID=2605748 RepID=A0A5M6D239_9BACT|nr:hypothetical protein [Roseiconus nitratireducens]KAA5539195.1 hypothetical protein FYK55_25070 [Roseiconus nitratireducens]
MNEVKLQKVDDHRLPTAILGGSLAPDARSVVAACMDGIYTVDLDSGDYDQRYAHDSYASSAHWLADDVILSGGYDGRLEWFDLKNGKSLRQNQLHAFWSWETAIDPKAKHFASVTGQYLAGGYKYEPQGEREPSICVGSVETGEVFHRLPHIPSVQAVAFSPDGQFVAAGNLMGEVRVFEVSSGKLAATVKTPDFTSWGIIKSHCYLGGIFAMRFTPAGDELLLAGMGEMRDPMAGNGKQLWQKWKWDQGEPRLVDQIHDGEHGEGLMEALAIHPSGDFFAMGGRLRGGDWNVALFALDDGRRLTTLKTGYRVTTMHFTPDGSRLIVLGTQGQPKPEADGMIAPFGRAERYVLSGADG